MFTKTQIIGITIGVIMIIFQIVATRQAFENVLKLIKKNRHLKSDKLKQYGQQDQRKGGSKNRRC